MSVLLQIPTPTAPPPPPPPGITIPGSYNIWYFADDAVGWWNQLGSDKTQVLQIAVIVVIVFVSMLLITSYVRSFSNESESPSE
jgi:hypothetical protein